MKFSLPCIGALLLCISTTAHATEAGAPSPVATAGRFVEAFQHQHYKEAASMFAPGQAQDSTATERTLKRIGETLGGLSTMHPIPTLPEGTTIKLEVPAHRSIVAQIQRFRQVRYTSTASDGQPVFYELNITADDASPKVLSFGVHFPAADAPTTARANHFVSLIER